jgi:hypothetical protein
LWGRLRGATQECRKVGRKVRGKEVWQERDPLGGVDRKREALECRECENWAEMGEDGILGSPPLTTEGDSGRQL